MIYSLHDRRHPFPDFLRLYTETGFQTAGILLIVILLIVILVVGIGLIEEVNSLLPRPWPPAAG